MARLRSLGSMSFTTRSPIFSVPSLMSSRPTIMLRSVDFPHPEGPTRMKNSPSSMVKSAASTATVPSGNRLLTESTSMTAMPCLLLALDGAGRQPGHDAALEDQHHDDDRDRHDHGGGGDGPGRLLELGVAGEERQSGRDGAGPLRRRQRDG